MKIKYHLDKNKIIIIAIIVSAIFALDQFTKWLAYEYLQQHFTIPVIGDFFRLTYVENPGMAFGIRIANKFLFNALSILAAIILVFYLTHLYPGKSSFTYSIACILGGAFGNLFDRLVHGVVIDFFDFEFWNISIPAFKFFFINFGGYSMTRWPVFNIADIAVSVGMILIFISVFWEYERKQKNDPQNNDENNEPEEKIISIAGENE
ncbi:MAG: signal peptidase II [Calditrichia bacterium]|nr:signal peptidase II [Calditrichia bacterium]